MTNPYFYFGGLALLYLGKLFYAYHQKRKMRETELEIADFQWKEYLKLRQETLSVTPANLDIKLPKDTETAFGIVTELHFGTSVHFVIVFKTGEIWSFSTESARKDVFSKSNNETVIESVAAAFDIAQYSFARMQRNFTGLLEPGHVKFHILTNIDVYSTNAFMWDIEEEDFVWEELWNSMNRIVEETQNSYLPSKPITIYWKRRESSRKDLY